ncbi:MULTISPECIES: hypothetical protein [unclassified Streptomyces]|uniref:hypothetical protein n=1 Tax=unclassified Streptomyces TaxID=2593676 RepID=UPI0004C103F6|nr:MULTISPECIES: hypothetical protein [unclassified Streptomyces]
MALGPTRATQPHLAVVYADAFGDVECFEGRPMKPSQQVFSRYRTRYEVDLRAHTRTAVLGRNPLVSRDGVHTFEVTVSFTFGIDGWDGAKNWVRAGLEDALTPVHQHLITLFHGAGRRFDIRDASGLEHHLNQLCARPTALPAGLRLHGCRVWVSAAEAARTHEETLIRAAWREEQGAAEHTPDLGETRRQGEIDALKQAQELAATARQARALAGMLVTAEDLIKQYLVTHPHDAAGAFAMLRQMEDSRAATAELQNQRALGLFEVMADKGLIQSGDLDLMRRQLTGTVGRATGGDGALPPVAAPLPALGTRPWDAPPARLTAAAPAPVPGSLVPGASAPGSPTPGTPTSGTPAPGIPAPGPGTRPAAGSAFPAAGEPAPTLVEPSGADTLRTPSAAFAGAALIYLVLDESLDRASVDELNRGLAALHSALSAAPRVSAALRLCVLGMAATTEPRLHLEQVVPGTRTPILVERPGLSYTHAFRTLKSLIGQDVTVVRAEGVQVLRPVVYFLTGGVPEDATGWEAAHRELTDAATHPAAPHLIALGIGRAEPRAVRTLATRPEFGFTAAPHQDTASAAHSCAALLRDGVVGYGERLAAGDPQFSVTAPDGFRPAQDAL